MARLSIIILLFILAIAGYGYFNYVLEDVQSVEKAQPGIKAKLIILSEIDWILPEVPSDLDRATSDYEWRIDLVNEQQGRIDLLTRIKSGVRMDHEEYKAWLDDLKLDTEEHILRVRDTSYSGKNYKKQIDNNLGKFEYVGYDYVLAERERIKQNEGILTIDMNLNVDYYNQQVEFYNSEFF